ncbi:MAG: fibro-slime domain-containing protein [Bacteroidales bacterium]|nr:fibro-slime domain-containing protein [Bacteroidales bacterium]
MKKKALALVLAFVLVLSLAPMTASAEDQNVELTVTVRDFNADGVLFEGGMESGEGLVKNQLGADKKPVYNLALWQEYYGESVTQSQLNAFFNDVPGVNMKTTKSLTLRPCTDEEYTGYWEIDSSIGPNGEELDGYFPIDNELFGNKYMLEGEEWDDGHNFHFSVEIHTRFKYVQDARFWFSGDDDVWVFFNGQLVIDLGGVHGEQEQEIALDDIAAQLGIKVGDIVDFEMCYMERHTTGSNMRIRTNFDFLNLQASSWATAELEQAAAMGLIPDCLNGTDLTQNITRGEFAAVSVKLYEYLTTLTATPAPDTTFTDTKDPEVLKAYNVGITNGVGGTTEFRPNNLISRQEAATMITRVYKKVNLSGWTLETDGQFAAEFKALFTMPALFDDDAQIDGWARDSVYFMAANGIIKGIGSLTGVGDNCFAPKLREVSGQQVGNASREVALLISVRTAKNLG